MVVIALDIIRRGNENQAGRVLVFPCIRSTTLPWFLSVPANSLARLHGTLPEVLFYHSYRSTYSRVL